MAEKGTPLNASVSARFLASLRGSRAAGFGIIATSGVITVVSIIYNSIPGLIVGAGEFILGAAYLIFVNTQWGRKPEFLTAGLTEADGSKISVRVPSSPAALMVVREMFQGRKPLPTPTGEVLGNPADKSALRAYSAEESEAAAAKMREELERFERQIAADAAESSPRGNDARSLPGTDQDAPQSLLGTGGAVKLD